MTTTAQRLPANGNIITTGPDAGEGIEILFDAFCEETGHHPTDPQAIQAFAAAAGHIEPRQVGYLASWVEEIYA